MNPHPSTSYPYKASDNDESRFDEPCNDESCFDESFNDESTGIEPSPGYKKAYWGPNGFYSSDEEDESFRDPYPGRSPTCKRLRDSDGKASDGDESDGWIDLTEEPEAKRPRAESPIHFCVRKECTRGEGDGTQDAPFTLSDPPDFSAILALLEKASKHDRLLHAIPETLKHVLASSLFYGKEAYDLDESAAGVKAFAKRMALKWEEFQRNRAIATKNLAEIAAL